MAITYREKRSDGWPLCPGCGEDELYSLIWRGGPKPSLSEFLASRLRCYLCGWDSERRAIQPKAQIDGGVK